VVVTTPIIIKQEIAIKSCQHEALAIFAYFDVFHYPLTIQEVSRYSKSPISEIDLFDLVEKGALKKIASDYYCLVDSQADLNKRIEGNKKAQSLEKKAIRKANFIGRFPFVRSVCISGSMSKGYMDEDADLDFFIITKAERLWIARTFLILYKKVFLFNSRKFFCINYLIDTEHLEIEEQNQFTATEVVTLINVFGQTDFDAFVAANQWAYKYYPNMTPNKLTGKIGRGAFKKFNEWILNGWLGAKLDGFYMKVTLKRWERKFGSTLDEKDFEVAFKTRKYVSKHHPGNFQRMVLDQSAKNLKQVELKLELA